MADARICKAGLRTWNGAWKEVFEKLISLRYYT